MSVQQDLLRPRMDGKVFYSYSNGKTNVSRCCRFTQLPWILRATKLDFCPRLRYHLEAHVVTLPKSHDGGTRPCPIIFKITLKFNFISKNMHAIRQSRHLLSSAGNDAIFDLCTRHYNSNKYRQSLQRCLNRCVPNLTKPLDKDVVQQYCFPKQWHCHSVLLSEYMIEVLWL